MIALLYWLGWLYSRCSPGQWPGSHISGVPADHDGPSTRGL